MKLDYGRPWTPEEGARLRSLISERLQPHEIAVKLRRTNFFEHLGGSRVSAELPSNPSHQFPRRL